jgi:hypothetical protein
MNEWSIARKEATVDDACLKMVKRELVIAIYTGVLAQRSNLPVSGSDILHFCPASMEARRSTSNFADFINASLQ